MLKTSRPSARPARLLAVGLSTLALVATTVAAAPAAGAAERPTYAATIADAQVAIEETLAATGSSSITASITDANALIWAGTAGTIDAAGTQPSDATMFGIGSTSKMFATTAVMQLVDQGKVGLDQPVVKYLPAFTMKSPQFRQITVRMLLNHTAGVPGSSYSGGVTRKPFAGYAEGVLRNLSQSTLKTTPGAMSTYCNDCFTLAGEVVAAVSGMRYEEYVARNILRPLGMDHSRYLTTMPEPGTMARIVQDGATLPLEVSNFFATGGLASNGTDMSAFARMLLNQGTDISDGQQILRPASVAEMGRQQLATTLDPIEHSIIDYGLGWDTVSSVNFAAVGQRAWVKGGDVTDYHASLVVLPEAGLAAFVAGAGRTFGSGPAEALAQRLLFHALAERGDIPAVPKKLDADQPAGRTPTADDINAIVGTYLGSTGRISRVTRGAGDSLTLWKLADGEWVEQPGALTFRADGRWWAPADSPLASMSWFAPTGWSRTYLATWMPNGYGNARGTLIFGQRVESTAPTAAAWRARLGEWVMLSERPEATMWEEAPVLTIGAIPGLPGYLDAVGLSSFDASAPNKGSMFLQVPLMFGRDHDDVLVSAGRLRWGGFVWSDLDDVPTLAAGTNAVRVGADGYAQWREVPVASTIAVRGASAWKLYDGAHGMLAAGTGAKTGLRAPKGSLLVVFGKSGQTLTITR